MSALAELASTPEVVLLAAARSHTDSSARRAISAFGLEQAVLTKLDRFGYILRAGEEWRLEPGLRDSVLDYAPTESDELWLSAHGYYFEASDGAGSEEDPAYMLLGPGFAYHGSELDPHVGMEGYRRVAHVESLAVSVDALRMAEEQGSRGVIDSESDALVFLRGMTYYREGRFLESIRLLRGVAAAAEQTREVAIAQHLVARWDCQRGGEELADESRRLFKLSLKNAVARNDTQHQAHVEHSMALCLLSQQRSNADRVVQLLRHSLELTQESGDEWGSAKVMHSLGQVLAKLPKTRSEAIRYLQLSREVGLRFGFQNHVRAVDESLAAAGSGSSRGVKQKRVIRRKAW